MKATLAAATLATLISSSAVLADSHDTDAAETVKIEAVPDGMRGLSGLLQAQLVSTDIERGTFVARIASIDRLWKKNTAKKPEEGIGKAIEVAGVTGKWLDVLISMKNGDMIEFEARHVSGDDLTFIAEGPKKVDMTGVPEGLYGFRGILVGTLVSKDIEKGTLVFRVDSVKRTWPKNKAKGPEAAKGRAITVHGISGKWLDVALGIGQGDHLEIEAFHNSGDHLDFTGEWLKRVE